MKVCPRTRPPHRAVAGIAAAGLSAPARRSILSPITVDDARGSLVGWRSTVSLQTVSGLDAAQLASTRLCVTPHPTTLVAGNPADIVRSSPRACAGPGDPLTDTAGLTLALPNGAAPANLTASLAVSANEPATSRRPTRQVGKLENLFEVDGNRNEQEPGERSGRAHGPHKEVMPRGRVEGRHGSKCCNRLVDRWGSARCRLRR